MAMTAAITAYSVAVDPDSSFMARASKALTATSVRSMMRTDVKEGPQRMPEISRDLHQATQRVFLRIVERWITHHDSAPLEARCRVTVQPNRCGRSITADGGRDGTEGGGEFGAEQTHGADDHDGDEGSDQAIFDGGGAGFV